jgi:hypothetical protein
MSAFAGARRWRWLAVGGAAVVVLAVAGPFVYINFVEGQAPRPLVVTASRSSTQPPATSGSTGLASGPIKLPSIPAEGATINVRASGRLTLHGATRAVTVNLAAQRSGDTIQVSGQIPVTFADWNISNPSFGPVSTDDHGQIEFLLVLAHA